MFVFLYTMTDMHPDSPPMPHRERVAWLSLIAIALTFGPYTLFITTSPPTAPLPDLRTMAFFAATTLSQALLLGIGHLWIRARWPEDARLPADERDRAIAQRAVGAAYHVLIVGMILVGCVMPFVATGWKLVNAAALTIVLAEIVHYGLTVWSYRKGRHA